MAVDLEVLVDEEQERVLLGRSHAGGMETSCWDPVEQSDMMNLLLTAHLISAIHSGTTHALIGCSAWDDAPPGCTLGGGVSPDYRSILCCEDSIGFDLLPLLVIPPTMLVGLSIITAGQIQ